VLREKNGKFGWFMGCSTYPECRHTEKIQASLERNGNFA
jgi:ssDNA-binding Zn-finger/Zn-ribbon topoisomerase 1